MGSCASSTIIKEVTEVTEVPAVDKPMVDEPTVDKPTVNKETYVAWEKEVITRFFTSEHKVTALIPTDKQPAFVSKEKYILVVDACDAEGGCVSEKVGAGTTEGLPEHQHVQLWHINKKKGDGVRFGYAVDDGIFKHPACDLGGLTNLRQKLAEPVAFAGTPVPWVAGTGDAAAVETVAESLVAQWRELTGKELTPSLVQDVTKFVGTVDAATTLGSVMLRFHLLPTEHRVVVTHDAVKAATGNYYVRVYGKGDDTHAKASDGKYPVDKDFFCAVTEKFVTSNLNHFNLQTECVTYT